jgi:hypothetical protein
MKMLALLVAVLLAGSAKAQSYLPNSAGTWTPTITGTSTPGTPTYLRQVGTYEQLGRLVILRFYVSTSAFSPLPTGQAQIGGLPLALPPTTTPFDDGGCHLMQMSGVTLTANYTVLTGLIAGSTSTTVIALYQNGSAQATTTLAGGGLGAAVVLAGICNYHL